MNYEKMGIGKKIALGAMALFLAGNQPAIAQTFNQPKPEIKGAVSFFGYNNSPYTIWPEGKITSENGQTYLLKEKNCISETGDIMPASFFKEAETALTVASSKLVKDKARVLDYFTYFHTPSKQLNTFPIFSDGKAYLGANCYDIDADHDVFNDPEADGLFGPKDQQMSPEFAKTYIDALKKIKEVSGLTSSSIFPPISERERLTVAFQIEDHKDYLQNKGSSIVNENYQIVLNRLNQTEKNIFDLKEDIKLMKDAPGYDVSQMNADIEVLKGEKEKILKSLEELTKTEPKIVYVENSYNDSALKAADTKITAEIDGIKVKVNEYNTTLNGYDIALKALGLEVKELKNAPNQETKYLDLEKRVTKVEEANSDVQSRNIYDGSLLWNEVNKLKNKPIYDDQKVWDAISVLQNTPGYNDKPVLDKIEALRTKLKLLEPLEGIAKFVEESNKPTTDVPAVVPQTSLAEEEKSVLYEQPTPIVTPVEEEAKQNAYFTTLAGLFVGEKGPYVRMGMNLEFMLKEKLALGLGVRMNILNQNELLESVSGDIGNTGHTYEGTTTSKNRVSIEGILSVLSDPLMLEFSLGNQIEDIETIETIRDPDGEVSQNDPLLQQVSTLKYGMGVGMTIPTNKNFNLGLIVRLDNTTGISAGIFGKYKFPLEEKKEEEK